MRVMTKKEVTVANRRPRLAPAGEAVRSIAWTNSNSRACSSCGRRSRGRQLLDFVEAHEIPVNPLHAQGFASIGCAPCTRRILEGEDSRAGRWSGREKTECGIHFGFTDGAGI